MAKNCASKSVWIYFIVKDVLKKFHLKMFGAFCFLIRNSHKFHSGTIINSCKLTCFTFDISSIQLNSIFYNQTFIAFLHWGITFGLDNTHQIIIPDSEIHLLIRWFEIPVALHRFFFLKSRIINSNLAVTWLLERGLRRLDLLTVHFPLFFISFYPMMKN